MMLAHTYPHYSPGGIYPRQQPRQQKQRPSSQQQSQTQQQFQSFQQGDFALSHQPAFSTTRDNIPTAAAAIAATQRQSHSSPVASNSQVLDSMPSDSWMLHSQYTPRQAQRFGHQRNSSLSSVGSNTPVSPYNPNTTNPRIAVTDVVGDGLHDITGVADGNYTFDITKPMTLSDSFYTNGLNSFNGHSNTGMDTHTLMGDIGTPEGLPGLIGTPHRRQAGLAPGSEMTASSHATKSRPMSVASSVGGDSPATPSFQEQEDEHRRPNNGEADSPVFSLFDSYLEFSDEYSHPRPEKIAFTASANMPKLNRTMTDAYTDELYNPNFAMTSTSPPAQQSQPAPAPTRDLFSRTLHAANNQHLFAPQSPMMADSRELSPFRQGSPYASALNEIPKAGTNRARLESSQQLRERRKAESDAKQLQQQQQGTPATISPKDAMLEFNEAEIDSNLPLFPPHEINTYGSSQPTGAGHLTRVQPQQSASPFSSMSTTPVHSNFSFSMPSNVPHIQIPQEYPFAARQRSQQEQQHQQLTPSTSTFSRVSSVDTCNADNDSGNDIYVRRPERTAADSGTYTCTYHGCTLRFETPAMLQKHKREAHRQPNAVNHLRSQANIGSPDSNMANSQAGPHRCDRINPSTGKPCSAIFSRPYDLTRHEDTIHNAGKQKVRCDLCTEEKTFSRADALTRHYRVCHPDADIPGKHRKRGRTMGGM